MNYHLRVISLNLTICLFLASPCLQAQDRQPALVSATAVTVQQFENATLPGGKWGFWTGDGGVVSISSDTTKNYLASKGSIKGSYPARSAGGGGYIWCGYDVSALATRDLYVEFWAKMPTPTKQGLKFLKVFGTRGTVDTGNYANTTFGLDYTGVNVGGMYVVSFGDGSTVSNDTASVISFDGSNGPWMGRSYGTAVVTTPQNHLWSASNWGTTWHHFRMHVKFNSGTTAQNEVADGAYFVEIDGLVYVEASHLFNRHYSNGPIDRIELFGWTQTGTAPFEIWYDDVRISTGNFLANISTNRAPLANDQTITTAHDTGVPLTLSASDADSGTTLTYAILAAPAHGTLSGSGASRTYQPSSSFSGSDSFTFTASDGQALSNVATVSINVEAGTVPTSTSTADSGGSSGCGAGSSLALFILFGASLVGARTCSRRCMRATINPLE